MSYNAFQTAKNLHRHAQKQPGTHIKIEMKVQKRLSNGNITQRKIRNPPGSHTN